MSVSRVPAFLDRSALNIQRAGKLDQKGLKSEIAAVDPQGDTLVIRRETQDVGNACVMPQTSLTVTYRQAGSELEIKSESMNAEEAGSLYQALRKATLCDGVTVAGAGWIISELRSRSGMGGGAC